MPLNTSLERLSTCRKTPFTKGARCGSSNSQTAITLTARAELPAFRKDKQFARASKFLRKAQANEIIESLHITRENSFAGLSRRTDDSKITAQAAKIERYARVNHHVLLTGERGTGKTTIARQFTTKVRAAKNNSSA